MSEEASFSLCLVLFLVVVTRIPIAQEPHYAQVGVSFLNMECLRKQNEITEKNTSYP